MDNSQPQTPQARWESRLRFPPGHRVPGHGGAVDWPHNKLGVEKMTSRILVVDDDADTRDCLSLALRHQGYEVLSARDGMAGILAAGSYHPDLIILDINMPRISGYETCRVLRQTHEFKQVPILFLSVRQTDWDKITAQRVGGDSYVTKPYDMAMLLDEVRHMVNVDRQAHSKDGTHPAPRVQWVD